MRRLLLVFALAASPAMADDPGAAIEVGRFGVMLDQAQAAERALLPSAPAPASASVEGGLYRQLVGTVERFNALSGRVCREIALPAEDCTGPFAPAWLSTGETDDPKRLRAMIDETGARIGAFWGDMCAKMEEHFCDIE